MIEWRAREKFLVQEYSRRFTDQVMQREITLRITIIIRQTGLIRSPFSWPHKSKRRTNGKINLLKFRAKRNTSWVVKNPSIKMNFATWLESESLPRFTIDNRVWVTQVHEKKHDKISKSDIVGKKVLLEAIVQVCLSHGALPNLTCQPFACSEHFYDATLLRSPLFGSPPCLPKRHISQYGWEITRMWRVVMISL